jgi:hypothetical protein
MNFLTALLIVFGCAFAVCLGLAKMIQDLSRAGAHASPAILEIPDELAGAERRSAKAAEQLELNPMELSRTQ